MGEIRGHAGTAVCQGALHRGQHPSTPGSQPALPPGGGKRVGLSEPRFRPLQVGETVPVGARPPVLRCHRQRSCPSLGPRGRVGVATRATRPPPQVRGTDGPSLLALRGPLQRQAGWRRTGRAPGLAVSSQGSHTRAPASWSVSASLCRYMHAQGQQCPQRRRSRAGRRSRPGLAPSTPNSPRARQGLPGSHPLPPLGPGWARPRMPFLPLLQGLPYHQGPEHASSSRKPSWTHLTRTTEPPSARAIGTMSHSSEWGQEEG